MAGRAKALLRYEGRTLLERQLLLAPLFEEVFLVTDDPAPYAPFGVRCIGDVEPGTGAPGAVVSALLHAKSEQVVVLACDMPFVTGAAVRALLEAEAAPVVLFPGEGVQPFPGRYARALGESWRSALAGSPSLQELCEQAGARTLPDAVAKVVDPLGQVTLSVNSEADAARLGIELPT